MRVPPSVFKAYDIRGHTPDQIDAAFARRLGAVVSSRFGGSAPVVIGHDERPTSAGLAEAMAKDIPALVVGEVSTPQLYWAVRSLGASVGVMVTASHNAEDENGFKVLVYRDGGLEVIGGNTLRQLFDTYVSGGRMHGSIDRRDLPAQTGITQDYTSAVAAAAGWQGARPLAVSVDGPRSVLRVIERLGPVAPHERLGARFDIDGDRLTLFLDGKQLSSEVLFLALAEQLTLQPLVFDIRLSRAARERLAKARLAVHLSRVGHRFVPQAMREHGAVFGGELSGHWYWPEFGGLECPELTLVRCIEAGGAALFDRFLASYHPYPNSGERTLPITDPEHAQAVLDRVRAIFAGCRIDRTDGITVDAWGTRGYWFNIRPSHTEPALRLVVEAKENDLLIQVVEQIRMLID